MLLKCITSIVGQCMPTCSIVVAIVDSFFFNVRHLYRIRLTSIVTFAMPGMGHGHGIAIVTVSLLLPTSDQLFCHQPSLQGRSA